MNEYMHLIENKSASEHNGKGKNKVGYFLIGLTGAAAIAISIISLPFVTPALRKICLPYVPATDEQVTNILRALRGRNGSVIDLGSGDGRIVLAASEKLNLPSTGVELNLWLVWYSRIRSWIRGQSKSTSFIKRDLWKFNLKPYQNIVIFGVDEMMPALERKFSTEISDSCQIIACRFPLPSWTPIATYGEGLNTVWIYRHPNSLNAS